MADDQKLVDYLKWVTADLAQTRERLQEVEERHREPIAIVGMACRFPGGADSPEALWRLLTDGVDAISPLPGDRGWDLESLYHPDPDNSGTTYAREGGFLAEPGAFDADFFGVSPREGLAMDPQQRLLLETAWEALEFAGLDAHALRGSRTGVFIGAANSEYVRDLSNPPTEIEGHALTGNSLSIASGRISYVFGFEGPAVTIDTACSSSLVALHLACQALRNDECTLALAGGAAVMASPAAFVEMSRQRALAPDGRCKAFSAAADGFGPAEGIGLLAVERLSDAVRLGHRVLAVIRGSAVNQDGASNGLTSPNGPSQQRVIRQALASANLAATDIDAIEAHGTGTELGDPIEAQALLATYGKERTEPLRIGSVKSNIGHTQAAAGAAGVIKMVLALQAGVLPKTLHIDEPSHHIDWTSGKLALLTDAEPWPEHGRPRRAAVSSFGISGTNAHVILEQAPAVDAEPSHDNDAPRGLGGTGITALRLSAFSPAARRSQAVRLTDYLAARPDADLHAVAAALDRRSALGHRAVVLGTDAAQIEGGLKALASGLNASTLISATAAGEAKLAFLFSGQGAQRPGMGRELSQHNPVFAATLAAACAELDRHLDRPLRELLFAEDGSTDALLLDRTAYTQPGLFALEVALFRTAESQGLRPDFLLGHSIGELAAAHVAGVLSLPDACALVAARGRLMQALPSGGAMVSIEASETEVLPSLEGHGAHAGLAAINGPRSTVVSGAEDVVFAIAQAWAAKGRKTKRLNVSHAFHSPLMDPMTDEFRRIAAGLTYQRPSIPIISTVTGDPVSAEQLADADYWVQQIRQPVRFLDGMIQLARHGVRVYLELGPSGALTALGEECLEEQTGSTGPAPVLVPLLRRDRSEVETTASAFAHAWANGVPVPGNTSPAIPVHDLPTYPFQHERFWLAYHPGPANPVAFGADSADRQDDTADFDVTDLPDTDRDKAFGDLVRSTVAEVLRYAAPNLVMMDRGFLDMGFDSLTAVELRNKLSAVVGSRLPATLVFDYPTPNALVEHLATIAGPGRGSTVRRVTRRRSTADIDEPIAIVGMACRFPGGADSPEALWNLVVSGTDAISPLPTDRGWDLAALYDPEPGKPGKCYVREGGFLADPAGFDAEFFGISPREALAMDPQQRLLLELSWEALEHAGLDAQALRGSRTGVFVGALGSDYVPDLEREPKAAEGFAMIGNSFSVVSGRISYVFGFEGPAFTLDTACSSALVALHLAGQALRNGECSLALVGGATVFASPAVFLGLARQQALAADGRCKAFAAGADGLSTAEGVGVLAVERLSDARRSGHRILAVMRGSAVNQDGASSGLTAPNGPSQQRVIHQALANARLSCADVDAVEAHGTGTRLGDPIEAQALLAAYGQDRPAEQPLWLGSVKSSIGHTQAAAGMAGVIKTVMALRAGVLAKSLHIDAPSPEIDWDSGAVSLLTETIPWPDRGRPRRAGVSSFGISGTNAHLILEQAPPAPELESDGGSNAETGGLAGSPPSWPLSARGAAGLRAQAARLTAFLADHPATDAHAVAAALTRRSALTHRAVILGNDAEELRAGLAALAADQDAPKLVQDVARGRSAGPVFVFSGQGAQWPGMGADLLDTQPVFAEQIERCAQALAPHVDWSLVDVLRQAPDAPGLDRVDVVQPALWAVMVSLAELWRSRGVRPAAVVGHSQGEIAAAYVAGALSLKDSARIVALRSRAITALAGTGGMASLALPLGEVPARIARWDGRISIAVHNGPSSIVVAGEPDALAQLVQSCQDDGLRARLIQVDYASHSPHVEQVRDELISSLSGIEPHSGMVPLLSTVTGEWLDTASMDADYWYSNLRQPIQFEESIRTLMAQGHETFIEVGPHPVLTPGIQETADTTDVPVVTIGTLHRDIPGPQQFALNAARAWTVGLPVKAAASPQSAATADIDLPVYPFQHKRFWLAEDATDLSGAGLGTSEHPILRAVTHVAEANTVVLSGRLSPHSHPWLNDHRVAGMTLFPGTGFLDLAIHAAGHAACDRVDELTLESPLAFPERGTARIQIVVGPADDLDQRSITVHSRPDDAGPDDPWARHATGVVSFAGSTDTGAEIPDSGTWPPSTATAIAVDDLYDRLTDRGYQYGPIFQGLKAVWRDGDVTYAEITLPEQAQQDAARFTIHPALLDAALHAAAVTRPVEDTLLPYSWSDVTLHATGATRLRVRIGAHSPELLTISATDPENQPVMSGALALRPYVVEAAPGVSDSLFHIGWTALPTPQIPASTSASAATWALLGEDPFALTESADIARFADVTALGAAIESGAARPDAVLLCCAGDTLCDSAGNLPPNLADSITDMLTELLLTLQAWLADSPDGATKLVVLTRGAVSTEPGEDVPDLTAAPVWGMVRSAQSEQPGRFTIVDIDHEPVRTLLAAGLTADEPQLAIRFGRLLAPRLVRAHSDPPLAPPPGERAWRLAASDTGTLDGLAFVPSPAAAAALRPGQVRIAVQAAGLNFRDLVVSLGMLPGRSDIGGEAAGVVVEVAEDVRGLAVGDRVAGLVPEAFGPLAVVDQRLLIRVPQQLSLAEAATIPVAHTTAYEALATIADLQPGERILIHAATGGVGMAAIQLARHLGAEIHATAHRNKWHALRDLGIPATHIANSRTTDYQQSMPKVDVVLNSLTGRHIDVSLGLLNHGGRFIELGKTDHRSPETIPAHVQYQILDLTEPDPEHTRETLAAISELLAEGELTAIPSRTFPLTRAPQALRYMQQAHHTGKIVLTLPEDPQLRANGTTLITGGTGTLATHLAEHLLATGQTTSLLLASRTGLNSPENKQRHDHLVEAFPKARIDTVSCDTSDEGQLANLLASVPADRPLTTVVHTAATLHDATITTLTPHDLHTTLHTKITTALHLHHHTPTTTHHTYYSSAATTLGSPGQANYTAANTLLDTLATHRHHHNHPTTSIAWGLWKESGGIIGHLDENDLARLARGGVIPLGTSEGVTLYGAARAADRGAVVAAHFSTARLREQAEAGTLHPLWRNLIRATTRRAAGAGPTGGSLTGRLAVASAAERTRILLELVRGHVATVLGHSSAATVETGRGFVDLGFDSLTAVEFRNRLTAATGLRLPATLIFDYPNPAVLAEYLRAELVPDDAAAAGQAGADGGGAASENGEAQIRRALAGIPLHRLRDAGLIDTLMQLAGATAGQAEVADPAGDEPAGDASIDSMDLADLLSLAYQNESE